jgi:hypothetical protein
MSNFHKVRGNGCILLFPYTIPERDRFRGGQGYVVDLDAPCEAEWCKDQLHKLEPAPEATKANAIVSPLALRALAIEVKRQESAKREPERVAVGASVGGEQSTESLEVARPVAKRKAS